MQTAVRLRAYPTDAQQRLWAMHDGACRVVFNLALNLTLHIRQSRGEWVDDSTLTTDLKVLRNDPDVAPWLQHTPAQVLQQALRRHRKAWVKAGDDGVGRPRHKRKSGRQTFRLPQGVSVRRHSQRWGTVTMPGGGRTRLKVRWHRTPPGTVKSAAYVREADGTYWVSLVCHIKDRTPTVHLNDEGPVGVDLGVAVPVATSDGDQWTFTALNPKEAERLRRLEHKLARQQRGSANYRKTRTSIAKLKARARRRRHDFAEQVSHRLTNNHSQIVFENLQTKSMTKSARGTVDQPGTNVRQKAGLNRAILNVGWGRIIQRTKDKAERRGATVRQVSPAHTSQTCPDCGTVDGDQRVTRSRYECRVCGYHGHADIGAARNILARGALDTSDTGVPAHGTGVAACGDSASAKSVKQEQANGHSTAQAAA